MLPQNEKAPSDQELKDTSLLDQAFGLIEKEGELPKNMEVRTDATNLKSVDEIRVADIKETNIKPLGNGEASVSRA